MLEAVDVTVARGRRVLATAFCLRVGGGELVHVAGPNGCGKSSLLRVLAGVVEPRHGSVRRPAACSFVPERVALPLAAPVRSSTVFAVIVGGVVASLAAAGVLGPLAGPGGVADALSRAPDDAVTGGLVLAVAVTSGQAALLAWGARRLARWRG